MHPISNVIPYVMMLSQSLPLEIRETAQDLQILLNQQTQPHLKDKVAALYLLKLGKVNSSSDLARIIGHDRATVEHWLKVYSSQGLTSLLTPS
jgi:hypothetical protein